jgi:mono/diheme cytochrome c family protein
MERQKYESSISSEETTCPLCRYARLTGNSRDKSTKWWRSFNRVGERVKSNYLFLGIAALGICGLTFAQDQPAKKSNAAGGAKNSAAAAERGKEIFEKKCAVCHYADSDSKKIGPGLKGIGKRGTFTVNNNKVTDETLKTWIENGDTLMPPFKEVLEPAQIKDVVAYVKTL